MRELKKKLAFFVASLFGVGFIPVAPGTFGSAISFIFIIPIFYFYGSMGILLFSVLVFVIGVLASKKVLKYTEHDPGLIVIDELLGQSITFLFVAKFTEQALFLLPVGFLLFRLFDILKPGIIGKIDKNIKNAYGVMLDDLMAGLFAAVALTALLFTIQISRYFL